MTQNDRWEQQYQVYMRYLKENNRRPSKHHSEDATLHNWYKQNRKLLNSGKLMPHRVEKFKMLLAEAEKYRRLNQYTAVVLNEE